MRTSPASARSLRTEDARELPFGFVVELDRFQGPLDLLLHLIRQQDIDIFDIPIHRITQQFLAAVKEIRAEQLDSAGEFLEMASTLVRIKAQLILPRPAADEEDDPRAELVRRLLEYEQIREITRRLERAEADRARLRGKGYVQDRPRPSMEDVPLETTWDEVYEAALEVRLPEPMDRDHRITPRTVSMEEKAILILNALKRETGVEFSRLLKPFGDRMHGVMTFLAGLELSRRRRIHLRQTDPFEELWLYLRKLEQEDGEDEPAGLGEFRWEADGSEEGGKTTVEEGTKNDRTPTQDTDQPESRSRDEDEEER